MDIQSLQNGIVLFNSALSTLRQVIALMPDTPDKKKAQVALEQAERKFKIAEAETAAGFGYEVYRNHFPPER